MGILKYFLKRKDNEITREQVARRNNVVSMIKKENQRIEARLSNCIKLIQQSMAERRKEKNHPVLSKIMVKTSTRPLVT
jgi:hypothetical protein